MSEQNSTAAKERSWNELSTSEKRRIALASGLWLAINLYCNEVDGGDSHERMPGGKDFSRYANRFKDEIERFLPDDFSLWDGRPRDDQEQPEVEAIWAEVDP